MHFVLDKHGWSILALLFQTLIILAPLPLFRPRAILLLDMSVIFVGGGGSGPSDRMQPRLILVPFEQRTVHVIGLAPGQG